MKGLEPKEYLSQIRYIDNDIRSRQEEVERLQSTLTVNTSSIKEDKVQESRQGYYDDRYMAYLKEKEKINSLIDKLVNLKVKITNEIDLLEDRRHRVILREYYLNMRSFQNIAYSMNYDVRHIHRLHDEALLAIKDVIVCH